MTSCVTPILAFSTPLLQLYAQDHYYHIAVPVDKDLVPEGQGLHQVPRHELTDPNKAAVQVEIPEEDTDKASVRGRKQGLEGQGDRGYQS